MFKKILGLLLMTIATEAAEKLTLHSSAFKNSEPIDKKYSLEGENQAPALAWSHAPKNTKSFALIVDDPDAPTDEPWVHWVVFNIPASVTSISKSFGRKETLSDGTMQGTTTFEKIGYDGPKPPRGEKHSYHFKIYALDTMLKLPAGTTTKSDLLKAMKGHIVAQAELIGTYQRAKK